MIPIYSNSLGVEELDAVRKVFDSKWIGRGRECDLFEKELADMWKTEDVLLTNCCSAAINISLRSLGISAGDEVIISSLNFVAIANTVMELGAVPVFADVDPLYFNILPSEIDRLKSARTKAVFMLHYGGHPADFDEIEDACGKNIAVLEDSANSVLSLYKSRYCGTLGAAGVFSFDAMKTLVMGDGGALVIQNSEMRERAKILRYLGLSERTVTGIDSMKQGASRWWEFEVEEPSGRFISNDILAAIGRVQLKRIPQFIERRKQVWQIYQSAFSSIPEIETPPEPLKDTTGSYYLYWIKLRKNRDALARHLIDNGIYASFRYFPLNLVKKYGSSAILKNALELKEIALNLPIHQNLTDYDIDKIIECVKKFYR